MQGRSKHGEMANVNSRVSKLKKRLESLERSMGVGKPMVVYVNDVDKPDQPAGTWSWNGEYIAPSAVRERARKLNATLILVEYVDGLIE